MRLFTAINLPETEKRRLSSVLATLPTQDLAIRWLAPESLHITIKFLGDVADARLPDIRRGLREAAADVSAFDVEVSGFGAFPSLDRPSILWVGVAPASPLLELQRRIELVYAGLGFAEEQRAFAPHVTVGKTPRREGRRDRAAMDRMVAGFDYKAVFRVTSVDLMRSRLGPRGASYDVVDRMELIE